MASADASAKPQRADLKVLLIPAFAAALALAVWSSTPRLGALAAYELEVVSPAAGQPGRDPVAPIPIGPGGELSLLLRPRAASTEAVDASVFIAEPAASVSQPLKPVAATAQEVGPGTLRVTLDGSALPASGRLLVLVGRSGLLPGSPVGEASHGRDWQRFELAFTTAPAAP